MATVPPTTSPSDATSNTSTPAAASPAAPTASDFATRLDVEMKHIAAHATSVETLKNGAKLYHLPNGRVVEQVPGKTPYVVKAGTGYGAKPKPATPATAPTTTAPTTTAPTTTTPSTSTTPTTTPAKSSATSTSQ